MTKYIGKISGKDCTNRITWSWRALHIGAGFGLAALVVVLLGMAERGSALPILLASTGFLLGASSFAYWSVASAGTEGVEDD